MWLVYEKQRIKETEEDRVEQVSAPDIPSSSTSTPPTHLSDASLMDQPQSDGGPKVPSDHVKLILSLKP